MARERSPERNKTKQMWLESGGAMKLKDIPPLYLFLWEGDANGSLWTAGRIN
ncbi:MULTISPECIES: phage terminase small subunit-related protein [Paenibacillus]|uniref:phage terminase small subunit-related protein n=1 Tax=Paenibacillus TaxID=44249 RepID=UPI001E374FEB|nr:MULTISPECIES: phage terminase small subunit-related protein [Paenibacillus]